MPQNNDNQGQSGNVFLFILLGVALFAALSLAVARGFRSDSSSAMSNRQIDLAATEILNYAQRVERAVDKVRRNGCSETQISFQNNILSGYNHSPPPANKCHLFNSDGGALSWLTPSSEWLDPSFSSEDHFGQFLFTGSTCIDDYPNPEGVNCNTLTPAEVSEIVMFLPYIGYDLCVTLNKKLNINSGTNNEPGQDNGSAYATNAANVKYRGTFTNTIMIKEGGYTGLPYGCFIAEGTPATGSYNFYYVLLAR